MPAGDVVQMGHSAQPAKATGMDTTSAPRTIRHTEITAFYTAINAVSLVGVVSQDTEGES